MDWYRSNMEEEYANSSFDEIEEENADILLSYSSSDFDESNLGPYNTIQPFMYEPEAVSSSHNQAASASSEDDDEDGFERLGNTEWCTCGSCVSMPTARECVCCNELEKVREKLESSEAEGLGCITQHPGFSSVCLDTYVLQTAYFCFRQQYGSVQASQNDHTAYRQLTAWCWEWLGRKVRVVLPSCAVNKIRSTFPSDSGQYMGYNDAQMSN